MLSTCVIIPHLGPISSGPTRNPTPCAHPCRYLFWNIREVLLTLPYLPFPVFLLFLTVERLQTPSLSVLFFIFLRQTLHSSFRHEPEHTKWRHLSERPPARLCYSSRTSEVDVAASCWFWLAQEEAGSDFIQHVFRWTPLSIIDRAARSPKGF